MFKTLALVAAIIAIPATVFAQAQQPSGGAVVGAIIGDAATPRFRTYVVEQDVPFYAYREQVALGAVLPEVSVVYREVPAEYGAQGYRDRVVNERPALVEPRTRRIVQIIN
ncbi:MAG: hypothetical protein B7Z40_19800 [Bosea sp. 12-68-7]|nr:MAG: hypothetical protein B7Z40_19800 [Bosea sp. 12-68-7]OYW96955.1 MAG: hypothetical protein B7Z14_18990 [Bosea sp. 32-68-6]